MKKKLFIHCLLVFTMALTGLMFITSCSDDESNMPFLNEVDANTAAFYEELGITDQIKAELATGEYHVHGCLAIYDQSGSQVWYAEEDCTSISPLTFKPTNLPKGKYTVVGFLTTCTKDGKMSWKLMNAEQLSTANVVTTEEGALPFTSAIGYASTTYTVGDNKSQVSLMFKSLGCIVDVRVDNFTAQSDYSSLKLNCGHQDIRRGFYLDPARSAEDRWVVMKDADTSANICDIKPGAPAAMYFTLNCGEDMSLSLNGYKDGTEESSRIASGEYVVTAGKNYIYYYDLNHLYWQPPFFGSHEDFTPWKADRDNGILVGDPCIKWGASMAEVEAYVKAKTWWMDENEELEYWDPHGWYKGYCVADTMITESYVFDEGDGTGLNVSFMVCYDTTLSPDVARTMLKNQGYVYHGKIQFPDLKPLDLYYSPDGVTEVMIYYLDNDPTWWEIFYQPTDPDDFQYILPDESAARAYDPEVSDYILSARTRGPRTRGPRTRGPRMVSPIGRSLR